MGDVQKPVDFRPIPVSAGTRVGQPNEMVHSFLSFGHGVRRRELIGSKSSPERGAVASATSAGEGELDCTVCFGTATC